MVCDKVTESYNFNSECLNTEQMYRGVEDLNEYLEVNKVEKVEIGSMDANSLYPSLKIDEVSDICYDMVINAPIKF